MMGCLVGNRAHVPVPSPEMLTHTCKITTFDPGWRCHFDRIAPNGVLDLEVSVENDPKCNRRLIYVYAPFIYIQYLC